MSEPTEAPPEPSTEPRDTFRVSEPAALRAIAHPLRQRILMELSARGHARAADLAEATGQPANAISFHLRTLARAGMIVEAPEHARDRRDRVWATAASSYRIEAGTTGERSLILAPTLAWVSDLFDRAGRPGSDEDEPVKRSLIINAMLLTKEEASALADELETMMMRWSDRTLAEARAHPEVPRDAYQLLMALGPREHSDTGPDAARAGS